MNKNIENKLTLYDYICNHFESLIDIKELKRVAIQLGISQSSLYRELNRLEALEVIKKIATGIYTKKELSDDEIIKYLYIERDNNCYGYFRNKSFLFYNGFPMKKPQIIEVASSKLINFDNEKIMISRTRKKISKANQKVLAILDFISDYQNLKDLDKNLKLFLIRYMQVNNISKEQMIVYLPQFPKAYSNYYLIEKFIPNQNDLDRKD